jgi:hypothetical protein
MRKGQKMPELQRRNLSECHKKMLGEKSKLEGGRIYKVERGQEKT